MNTVSHESPRELVSPIPSLSLAGMVGMGRPNTFLGLALALFLQSQGQTFMASTGNSPLYVVVGLIIGEFIFYGAKLSAFTATPIGGLSFSILSHPSSPCPLPQLRYRISCGQRLKLFS